MIAFENANDDLQPKELLMTRYAFWRNDDGSPNTKNMEENAPHALLSKIGRESWVNADKSVSSPFPKTYLATQAVVSAVAIIGPEKEELGESDTTEILNVAIESATKETGGRMPLNASKVLTHADKAAAEFYRRTEDNYKLIGTISLEEFPTKSITINSRIVREVKNRDKYQMPKSFSVQCGYEPYSQHIKSTRYKTVSVTTSGRSHEESLNRGIGTLRLLQSVWTLVADFKGWRISSGLPKPDPVARIHLGPVFTLYEPDGKFVENWFGYDPDYSGDYNLFVPPMNSDWNKIEKDRRLIMNKLRHHPFQRETVELLIRYGKAISNRNHDLSFLALWGVLEHLTDNVGARYNETIKRASFCFEDPRYERELLHHLRLRRNKFVHSGRSGEERVQRVYLTKIYVETILAKIIFNEYSVNSLQEFGEFLGMHTNIEVLKKRRDNAEKALSEAEKREYALKSVK